MARVGGSWVSPCDFIGSPCLGYGLPATPLVSFLVYLVGDCACCCLTACKCPSFILGDQSLSTFGGRVDSKSDLHTNHGCRTRQPFELSKGLLWPVPECRAERYRRLHRRSRVSNFSDTAGIAMTIIET